MTSRLSISRILVALDASADSQAALAAAASLAEALKAELTGLFVEDINLLQLARLPFAQELRYAAASPEQVDQDQMEKHLKAQAANALVQLKHSAEAKQLSWTFRVVRGSVTTELLAAAAEADLLVMGRARRSMTRANRMGSTARTALTESPRAVMLMHPGVNLNRPVLLVYDGSPGSKRALVAAIELAHFSGRLSVLICASDPSAADVLKQGVLNKAKGLDLQVRFRHLAAAGSSNLSYLLKLSEGELLVLSSSSHISIDTIQRLLENLAHPVLLMR